MTPEEINAALAAKVADLNAARADVAAARADLDRALLAGAPTQDVRQRMLEIDGRLQACQIDIEALTQAQTERFNEESAAHEADILSQIVDRIQSRLTTLKPPPRPGAANDTETVR